MTNCNGHEPYYIRAEADAALRRLVADVKRSGKSGKSWKRLHVWSCGNHWHLGRANQQPFRKEQPKAPTLGELRRKAKHEAKVADRYANRKARHGFAQMGFLVDVAEAARIAKERVDDLADSIEQARKLAARYVFVK